MKKILLISIGSALLFSACGEKSNVALKGRIAPPTSGPQPSDKKNEGQGQQDTSPQQKTIDQVKMLPPQQQQRTILVQKKGIPANLLCVNQLSKDNIGSDKLTLKLLVGSQIVVGQGSQIDRPKIKNQNRNTPLLIPSEILHILCANNLETNKKDTSTAESSEQDSTSVTLVAGNEAQEYPIRLNTATGAAQESLALRIACVTELDIADSGSELLQYKEKGADLILSAGSSIVLEALNASSKVSCEHPPAPEVPEELDAPKAK